MAPRSYSVFISSVLTLMLFAAITWFSCSKDKCNSTYCENGGGCYKGNCICSPGFEGTTCATNWRQKFFGNWQQTPLAGTIPAEQFAISIGNGATYSDVKIINFDNYFTLPVSGYMSSSDSLIIPSQVLEGVTVSGVAYYKSANNILVNYTTTSATGVIKTVSATW